VVRLQTPLGFWGWTLTVLHAFSCPCGFCTTERQRDWPCYSVVRDLRRGDLQDLKSRTQVISWVMFQMVGSAS
jgi:hypothetical protein